MLPAPKPPRVPASSMPYPKPDNGCVDNGSAASAASATPIPAPPGDQAVLRDVPAADNDRRVAILGAGVTGISSALLPQTTYLVSRIARDFHAALNVGHGKPPESPSRRTRSPRRLRCLPSSSSTAPAFHSTDCTFYSSQGRMVTLQCQLVALHTLLPSDAAAGGERCAGPGDSVAVMRRGFDAKAGGEGTECTRYEKGLLVLDSTSPCRRNVPSTSREIPLSLHRPGRILDELLLRSVALVSANHGLLEGIHEQLGPDAEEADPLGTCRNNYACLEAPSTTKAEWAVGSQPGTKEAEDTSFGSEGKEKPKMPQAEPKEAVRAKKTGGKDPADLCQSDVLWALMVSVVGAAYGYYGGRQLCLDRASSWKAMPRAIY
ncbi:uncharacterized protein B0T15DRAFT_192273 [Chaetomium strumarium]|uniref:Uncharacterized protein n=1 Tax=Chaetomium strumarium TaxID=1170767 RepID=A0AAJ0GSE6_9PEZI|nr:hypothetical protein B0T15DRAFT_192273 [Chaetomium strumarium]